MSINFSNAGGKPGVSLEDFLEFQNRIFGVRAEGEGALALFGAEALGDWCHAIGREAYAAGYNSFAVGDNAWVKGSESGAYGNNAIVEADWAMAIGHYAECRHLRSAAVGSGSLTTREHELSVGKAGEERFVANVKAGVLPTDAVNVGQLKNFTWDTTFRAGMKLDNVGWLQSTAAAGSDAYSLFLHKGVLTGKNGNLKGVYSPAQTEFVNLTGLQSAVTSPDGFTHRSNVGNPSQGKVGKYDFDGVTLTSAGAPVFSIKNGAVAGNEATRAAMATWLGSILSPPDAGVPPGVFVFGLNSGYATAPKGVCDSNAGRFQWRSLSAYLDESTGQPCQGSAGIVAAGGGEVDFEALCVMQNTENPRVIHVDFSSPLLGEAANFNYSNLTELTGVRGYLLRIGDSASLRKIEIIPSNGASSNDVMEVYLGVCPALDQLDITGYVSAQSIVRILSSLLFTGKTAGALNMPTPVTTCPNGDYGAALKAQISALSARLTARNWTVEIKYKQ